MNDVTKTANQRWLTLDGTRGNIIRRCERFATWTIAKVFPDSSYTQDNSDVSNEFQSLGAQVVNHLSNRLMMVLFAPSRPFFRLGPKKAAQAQLATIAPEQRKAMESKLSAVEREASDYVDKLSLRSKLYELFKLLIITGNAMMILRDDDMRVLTMRSFVVRRDVNGKVIELVIREEISKDELDPEAALLADRSGALLHPDKKVMHYRWVTFGGGKYHEDQWVNDVKLPAKFSSSYTMATMPYHLPTWDLSSGNHYGTGLVEDYRHDFATLTALSESTVLGAIMNSEFRWMLRPGAMTSAQDFANSANGDVLYGEDGDISAVRSGLDAKLEQNVALAEIYIRRIGSAFLLQSAVTRNAERVTAEELRINAEELEGSLGGAFSRLAAGVQSPLADFCMKVSGFSVAGTDFETTVITGLAALSRVGDRGRLLGFLNSLGVINAMNPLILKQMRISSLISDLAAAEGLDRDSYVLTDQELAAAEENERQQQANMMAVQSQISQGAPQ